MHWNCYKNIQDCKKLCKIVPKIWKIAFFFKFHIEKIKFCANSRKFCATSYRNFILVSQPSDCLYTNLWNLVMLFGLGTSSWDSHLLPNFIMFIDHTCLAPFYLAHEKRRLRLPVQKVQEIQKLLPVCKACKLVSLSLCQVSEAVW